MVLIELANANPKAAMDISDEQERAGDLVTETRLYRQTAAHTGDTQISGVLDELERVLVDITHAPSNISSGAIAGIAPEAGGRRHSLQDPRTGLQRPEPGCAGREDGRTDTLKGKEHELLSNAHTDLRPAWRPRFSPLRRLRLRVAAAAAAAARAVDRGNPPTPGTRRPRRLRRRCLPCSPPTSRRRCPPRPRVRPPRRSRQCRRCHPPMSSTRAISRLQLDNPIDAEMKFELDAMRERAGEMKYEMENNLMINQEDADGQGDGALRHAQ